MPMIRIHSIGTWQCLVVLGYLLLSSLQPHDRFTWVLEVSWVAVGLVIVTRLSLRGTSITPLLAWLLTLHALILIYGGWHTYERVPLGEWMQSTFGWERNHYDRIGHFAQGFIPAVLIREVLLRHEVVHGRGWLEWIVFAGCMAFTGLFEILEFAAALSFGGASDAYLGSQGDIWDAQWDLVYCGMGTLFSIRIFRKMHRKQLASMKPVDAAM